MDIFRLHFSSVAVLRNGNEIGVRVRREIALDSAEGMMYNELWRRWSGFRGTWIARISSRLWVCRHVNSGNESYTNFNIPAVTAGTVDNQCTNQVVRSFMRKLLPSMVTKYYAMRSLLSKPAIVVFTLGFDGNQAANGIKGSEATGYEL